MMFRMRAGVPNHDTMPHGWFLRETASEGAFVNQVREFAHEAAFRGGKMGG